GHGRLPALSVEPGPVLAIERTGQAPLRVPITAAGDMLVHWAGTFTSTLKIVPAATIINLSNLLRDREAYLATLSRNGVLEQTARLREHARELMLREPDRPIALAKLIGQVTDGPSAAPLAREYASSKTPARPDEERLPAAWYAFFKDF